MKYQALARKYRPQSFAEFVGQETTISTLVNALNSGQLHHAYLFSGTRGVGKTTLARLLSKCLNCEQGVSSDPCMTCTACEEIRTGRHMELIEIDAASRTKVEDTRELLDNVAYAASSGRFKIYLIDEVHMLSKHSFNALLKTLEEPPEHVKFILATTDPDKIPVTVRSRCLQFKLQRLSTELITERLRFILQQEAIEHDPACLPLVAEAADGSMRDALSLLDQLIAFCARHLDIAQTQRFLGHDHVDDCHQLLMLLAQSDWPALLKKCAILYQQGTNFADQLKTLADQLHRMATHQLLQQSGHAAKSHKLHDLCQSIPLPHVQNYYQICLHGIKEMPYAPSAQIGFEMTLMRMLAFTPTQASTAPTTAQVTPKSAPKPPSSRSDATPPARQHRTPPTQAPATTPPTAVKKKTPVQHQPQPVAATSKPATKALHTQQLSGNANDRWLAVVPQLGLSGLSQQIIQQCACTEWNEQSMTLCIDSKNKPLLSPAQEKKITDAILSTTQQKLAITISSSDQHHQLTPQQLSEQKKQQRLNQAVDQLDQDPTVNRLLGEYGASLIPNSIEAVENQE
jgi:DNA polymerase-3 subunit gamma/tau